MNKAHYYQCRIDAALQYIDDHLGDEIKVNDLAKAAHFSTYHFQRIYHQLQGETPYDTVLRLRLERAVFELKYNRTLSISRIAADCGFPSVENFSRQFKSRFGHSPSAFKKDKSIQNSRIYQESNPVDFYPCREDISSLPVIVEVLEPVQIAYIRAIFGSDGSILMMRYQELIDWAIKQSIDYQKEGARYGMSIDDPSVTPAGKYRYDFAVAYDGTEVEGLIQKGEIPSGVFASIHVQGSLNDVSMAWNKLYRKWLPESDYVPRHYPAIEQFIQGPEDIGWDRFNIKCRIPIKKI